MIEQNGDTFRSQANGGPIMTNEYLLSKQSTKRDLSTKDVEMLRLIGQYLCDKGLNSAYVQLSKESGIPLEHSDATELRHAILEGRWNDAELAVERLTSSIGDIGSVAEVSFLLLEQQFLEHLEGNEIMPAVTLLRNRITPMKRNTERVHTLASCLMCRTQAELQAQAGGWTGKDSGSRLQLINRIQAFVPPHIMLPPRRLEELIDESVRSQLATCIFHNPSTGSGDSMDGISLLQRHSCDMQDFPAFCIQTLDQRDTDLWVCQFSPDGSFLATAGKEDNVDVWRVDSNRHTIEFHRSLQTPAYVSCLCWSPDSKKLAICCREEQSSVFVFEVPTGQQLCAQQVNPEDTYTTATFFADSRKLAFGGLKGTFYVMDSEDHGAILTTVEGYRVQSMAAIIPPPPGSKLSTVRYTPALPMGLAATASQRRAELISAPGGPGSLNNQIAGGNVLSMLQQQMQSQIHPDSCILSPAGGDHLLVADSLNRIRLFRFGALGPTPTPGTRSMDVSANTPNLTSSLTLSSEPPFVVSETSVGTNVSVSTSDAPSSATVLLTTSGTSGSSVPMETSTRATSEATATATTPTPGAPSISEGSSLLNALAVARLSRHQRQQQMLQTSTANILVDMPILPASLGLLSSPNIIQQQQQQHGSERHPIPYTIVSSTSSSVGVPISTTSASPHGSSLSILFGPNQPQSGVTAAEPGLMATSAVTSTASSSTDVRLLTAAATAAAALAGSHSRSFAGLVHSLSTMVTGGAASASTSSASTAAAAALAAAISESVPGSVDVINSQRQGSYYGLLEHRTLFKETHPVQSITMSRSGQCVLITLHKMGLHLWDLNASAIVQRFIGHKQNTFRMHSTFGGSMEDFVAAGSEDGRVYFWHANSGSHPIYSAVSAPTSSQAGPTGTSDSVTSGLNSSSQSVAGGLHPAASSSTSGLASRMSVTCVHWNPSLPTMVASVNDAGEVCIWGPQRFVHSANQPMEDS